MAEFVGHDAGQFGDGQIGHQRQAEGENEITAEEAEEAAAKGS